MDITLGIEQLKQVQGYKREHFSESGNNDMLIHKESDTFLDICAEKSVNVCYFTGKERNWLLCTRRKCALVFGLRDGHDNTCLKISYYLVLKKSVKTIHFNIGADE